MLQQLAAILFVMMQGAFAGVDTDADFPIKTEGFYTRDEEYPFIFIVVVGSAIGLILTIASIVYFFAQEDPSKNNIVYKMCYQRLKTE